MSVLFNDLGFLLNPHIVEIVTSLSATERKILLCIARGVVTIEGIAEQAELPIGTIGTTKRKALLKIYSFARLNPQWLATYHSYQWALRNHRKVIPVKKIRPIQTRWAGGRYPG